MDKISREGRNNRCYLIYLDFIMTFDTQYHTNYLFGNWKATELQKILISWINSFLDQRCFCVNVIYSDFKTVASGILQCRVLGPILLVPAFWSYKFFCTSLTYLTNFHPIATCLLTTQKYSVKQR